MTTLLRSEDPEETNTFYSPSTTAKASIFVPSKELDFGYTLVTTLLVRLFIYFFGRCNLHDLSLIFRNWKIFSQLTLELFYAFFVIIVCCVNRLLFFLAMSETVNSLGKRGRCTNLELAHLGQLDARALRARKLDLYSELEVFLVRLRAPNQDGDKNIHETYHTISENILQQHSTYKLVYQVTNVKSCQRDCI